MWSLLYDSEHFPFYIQVAGLAIYLELKNLGLDCFAPVILNHVLQCFFNFHTCSGLFCLKLGIWVQSSMKLAGECTSTLVA